MAKRFDPEPGDTILLFNSKYIVQHHPKATTIPYVAEGRRGNACS